MLLFIAFAIIGHVCAQQARLATYDSRILFGQPATIEQYNFAAQIIYRNAFHCGGTLITQRLILSAAHCFYTQNNTVIPESDVTVRVGTANANIGGQSVAVSRIVIHNQYNPPARDNDLAIVVLASDVTLNLQVQTAQLLPANSVVLDNAPATYVGWGLSSLTANTPSPSLNQVQVTKVNQSVCVAAYGQLTGDGATYTVTNNMICAGNTVGGGPCQYDEGGPLVSNSNVVGVIAWGFLCGNQQYPGVNMAVANYQTWINETIQTYNSGSSVAPLSIIMMVVVSISSKTINF